MLSSFAQAPHMKVLAFLILILDQRVFYRQLNAGRVGRRNTRPGRIRIGTDVLVKHQRIVSLVFDGGSDRIGRAPPTSFLLGVQTRTPSVDQAAPGFLAISSKSPRGLPGSGQILRHKRPATPPAGSWPARVILKYTQVVSRINRAPVISRSGK